MNNIGKQDATERVPEMLVLLLATHDQYYFIYIKLLTKTLRCEIGSPKTCRVNVNERGVVGLLL